MKAICLVRLAGCALVCVLGVSVASTSRAQVIEDSEVSARQIDRESLDAVLAAEGLKVPELRFTKSGVGIKTKAERAEDARAAVLQRAAEFPDGLVEILVQLEDLPAFGAELQSISEEARLSVIESREELVGVSQGRFLDHARALGARVYSLTTVNMVAVAVEGSVLPKVIAHQDVVSVSPGWQDLYPNWTLQERRDQSLVQRYHDIGFWGIGTTATGRRSVAVIDGYTDDSAPLLSNAINNSHINWTAAGHPGSKIITNEWCSLGICLPGSTYTYGNHGSLVASVAAGGRTSFGPSRAGVLADGFLYYFRTAGASNAAVAVDRAILFGADSINMSWSTSLGNPPCSPQQDSPLNGMNAMLRSAFDAGVLPVGSATNNQKEPQLKYPFNNVGDPVRCNVGYPGHRPEVMAIGAIGDVSSSLPYLFEPLAFYSGRGWIMAGRAGSVGGADEIPAVSMVAPGVIEDAMWDGTSGFMDQVPFKIDGVSFAIPHVAGTAALMREWLHMFAPSVANSAGHLRAMVLVSGNGYLARNIQGASRWVSGASEVTGVGKIMAQPIHTMPGFGVRTPYVLNAIEGWTLTTTLPQLPAGTTVFKVASYVDTDDLNEVPHVLLIVRDACNGNQIIGYDFYFAIDKYIKIYNSTTLAGACPSIEIYGYSVPPGGVEVYTMAYWASGSIYDH